MLWYMWKMTHTCARSHLWRQMFVFVLLFYIIHMIGEAHLFKESSVNADVFDSWRSALVEAEEGEQRSTESWHFTILGQHTLELCWRRNLKIFEQHPLHFKLHGNWHWKLTSIGNSFLALSLSVSKSPLRRWRGSIRSTDLRLSAMLSLNSTVTYCGRDGPSII